MNYVTEKQSEQFINQLLSQIDKNTMLLWLKLKHISVAFIHPINKFLQDENGFL